MIKNLRYVFVSALMLLAGSVMAQTTIDIDADYKTLFPTIQGESTNDDKAPGEFNETTTSTAVNGVTLTVTASATDAANRNRIWSSAPRLRMFDGSLTIKAEQNFKKVVMTINTNKGLVAAQNTASVGTLNTEGVAQNNGTLVWEGDANEVTINIAGNTQFHKIEVSFDGSIVTPDPVTYEEINIAKAIELCSALEPSKTSADTYHIKGYVVEIQSFSKLVDGDANTFGNTTFTMADTAGETDATKLFTAFRVYGLGNQKITVDQDQFFKVGDLVVVEAKLKNFATDGGSILETNYGFIYSINGVSASISNVKNEAAKGVVYNMAGQRVMNAQKGLYIMNGKKYLVK